ncbi:helix-turn-helix domain-containing protein [Treponema sp. TIM-1]|uniref:hypothetical protein n=1 Tax=Treponema sp. TIM-1 TaxID=2898417 RepID=UPI0039809408
MTDCMLTKKEFADYTRVSLSTVTRGIKNKTWPYKECVKMGGHVRYPPSLLAKIEARAKKAGGQDESQAQPDKEDGQNDPER